MTHSAQHIEDHRTVDRCRKDAGTVGLPLIGIDINEVSTPIERATIPQRWALVFGQEGPGISPEMVAACDAVYEITQYGSTRSINVGVASGLAL